MLVCMMVLPLGRMCSMNCTKLLLLVLASRHCCNTCSPISSTKHYFASCTVQHVGSANNFSLIWLTSKSHTAPPPKRVPKNPPNM